MPITAGAGGSGHCGGKEGKPHRGPAKSANGCCDACQHAIKVPAASTIHTVLDRHGFVTHATRSRPRATGTPLCDGLHPNDLWATDYKGEFQLADKRYCYPLTVTDHASRYMLLFEALESNREELAFGLSSVRERGLPRAIRSDSARPSRPLMVCFSFPGFRCGGCGWVLPIERIRPGHPQQNGRHERMHLTLEKEATRPAGANILQQQGGTARTAGTRTRSYAPTFRGRRGGCGLRQVQRVNAPSAW
jgi:transposase InsO family protein